MTAPDFRMSLMEHIHVSLLLRGDAVFSGILLLRLLSGCIKSHNRLFLLIQLLTYFWLEGNLYHPVLVESVESDGISEIVLYHTIDDFMRSATATSFMELSVSFATSSAVRS